MKPKRREESGKMKKSIILILSLFMMMTSAIMINAEETFSEATQDDTLLDINDLPSVEEVEISEEGENFKMNMRSIGNITSEESKLSGNLTAGNIRDFYFIEVPEKRALTYAVTSSNPNVYVRFCTYDPTTMTVYPTDYYSDTNKVGVLGNLPKGQYILMVTYKDTYTNDAGYNILTNYNVDYKENMKIRSVSGDLSRVESSSNLDIYINRNQVTDNGYAANADPNDIFYVSGYLYGAAGKVSYSSLIDKEYSNMYGVKISHTSGMISYFSEKYQFDTAMLVYLEPSTPAEIRIHETHNIYEKYDTTCGAGSFMVYDYDTNRCYQLYLNNPEVPEDYRLIYNTLAR